VPFAPVGNQVLLLPPGKPDGPLWHSGLSDFLPRSSSALLMADVSVVAISCVVASMAKTLSKFRPSLVEVHQWWHPWPVPPRAKEDKVDTSSVEVPTAPALVARSKSKAPDDNLGDDNPDLLNFAAVGSEIDCQMSSRL
jgi:hypothetical protein